MERRLINIIDTNSINDSIKEYIDLRKKVEKEMFKYIGIPKELLDNKYKNKL